MTNSLVDSIGMISNSTIGQTINNYVLEKKLGEGGMGEVYLARHNRVDRVVAIKILHQNLFTNETIRNRFKNEANALIKLAHPNIIKIYDYIEQEAVACLIVEYFDGITLDDYINKLTGPIPSAKAIRIFCQILDAVQYAHDHNILHRDIKPGNIMVSRDGNKVRIMDFGIAKLQDAVNLNITHTNIQLGTPFYMGPEQVKGLPYSVQSDIYSLGVTLFEMVTGKCAYSGITNLFELQSKIVSEPLPSTETYYPGVPAKVQEAIKIATNKISSQRFKTCLEFKKFLEGEKKEPVIVPIPKVQQVIKIEKTVTKKKNYAWMWLLVVALITIGGMAYSLLKRISLPQQQPPPSHEQVIADLQRQKFWDSITVPPDALEISRREQGNDYKITLGFMHDSNEYSLSVFYRKDGDRYAFNNAVEGSVKSKTLLIQKPTPQKIIIDLKEKNIYVPETAQIDTVTKGQLFDVSMQFNDKKAEHTVWAEYKVEKDRYVLDNAHETTKPIEINNPAPPALEKIINDVRVQGVVVPEKRTYTHSKPEKVFTGVLKYEDENYYYTLTVTYTKGEYRYNYSDFKLMKILKGIDVKQDIVDEIRSRKKFRNMMIYPERNIEVSYVSQPSKSDETKNINYDIEVKIDGQFFSMSILYYPEGDTYRLLKNTVK